VDAASRVAAAHPVPAAHLVAAVHPLPVAVPPPHRLAVHLAQRPPLRTPLPRRQPMLRHRSPLLSACFRFQTVNRALKAIAALESPVFLSTARLQDGERGSHADGARDAVKSRHRRPRAGGALTDSYSAERISCATLRSSDSLPAAGDARTTSNARSGGQGVRGSFLRRSGGVRFPVADSHGLHRHGAGGGLVIANSSPVGRVRSTADSLYSRSQAGRCFLFAC
jgi:hypothetical protein